MKDDTPNRRKNMDNEIIKRISLNEELNTSVRLIKLGFGEYQNLDMANDFYYLPFQLISSGFERLMKCIICLGHLEKHGVFPNPELFRERLRHDLVKLKDHITENYFQQNSKALSEDLDYLITDKDLEKLVKLLSEFGKYARYYNLNIVTGEKSPGEDVRSSWEAYESSYVVNDKTLLNKLKDPETSKEVLCFISQQTIKKLERFTRALARQFTLGRLGTLALQYSPSVNDFLMIRDTDLGKNDYRKITTSYHQTGNKPHKRTIKDKFQRLTNKAYRSKLLTKDLYKGDWPFYTDEITLECRHKNWCVVSIDGFDYALNGAAKGRYQLTDVHEAGMAIMGKSISPFVNMALQLGETH